MNVVSAFWRGLCPRCRSGKVFAQKQVRAECDRCAYAFEPEPGYFVGAMYLSYPFAIAAALPLYLGVRWASGSDLWALAAAALELVFLSGTLRRLSRLLWLYFDFLLGRR